MFLPCPCLCNSCGVTGSIVWGRVGIGYRIENLQKKFFNLALILIKQYYFQNDQLLNALGVENDIKSITNLDIHMLEVMSTESSLILIDDRDDTIAGVLLLSVVNKMDFGRAFSHSDLKRGRVYEKCIALRNSMNKKVDFFLDYETNVILRFYLICIADEHRGKHLGYHLFRAGIEIARHMHIPIACGVFTSQESQGLAQKFGFEVVDSVNYEDWFEPLEDELYEAPDPRHCVALMVARMPPFYESAIVYGDKSDKKGKTEKGKKGKKGKHKKNAGKKSKKKK